MKHRNPSSVESAISEIWEKMGVEVCAAHIGKSASLIYKWSDPDNPAQPTLRQALALERLYVSAGHSHPDFAPILQVWRRLLKLQLVEASPSPMVMLASVMELPFNVGVLSKEFHSAIADGVITIREKQLIRDAIGEARHQLDMLEGALSEDATMELSSLNLPKKNLE